MLTKIVRVSQEASQVFWDQTEIYFSGCLSKTEAKNYKNSLISSKQMSNQSEQQQQRSANQSSENAKYCTPSYVSGKGTLHHFVVCIHQDHFR